MCSAHDHSIEPPSGWRRGLRRRRDARWVWQDGTVFKVSAHVPQCWATLNKRGEQRRNQPENGATLASEHTQRVANEKGPDHCSDNSKDQSQNSGRLTDPCLTRAVDTEAAEDDRADRRNQKWVDEERPDTAPKAATAKPFAR